jgi:hypothetical protein
MLDGLHVDSSVEKSVYVSRLWRYDGDGRRAAHGELAGVAEGVVLLSLRRALDRLHVDRATEHAVREVLQLMRVRAGESLSAAEVARRLERSEPLVSVIRLELADAFVLQRDGVNYSYSSDPVVEMDVERFVRRSEGNSAVVQTSVAKFRDRYGYR